MSVPTPGAQGAPVAPMMQGAGSASNNAYGSWLNSLSSHVGQLPQVPQIGAGAATTGAAKAGNGVQTGAAPPPDPNQPLGHVPYGPELTGASGLGSSITANGTPVVLSAWQRSNFDPTSLAHYNSYLSDIAGANPADFKQYSDQIPGTMNAAADTSRPPIPTTFKQAS